MSTRAAPLVQMFLQDQFTVGGRCKRRLALADDELFIEGPRLADEDQLVSPYDVQQGEAWCDGLNKAHWADEKLGDLMSAQCAKELQAGSLFVTVIYPHR